MYYFFMWYIVFVNRIVVDKRIYARKDYLITEQRWWIIGNEMWKVNTFPNAWPSKWYEQPLVQISGTHVLQPSVNFGDQSPGLRNYLRAVCHWESSEAKIVYYKEQRCKWYCWHASSILRYSYNHCNSHKEEQKRCSHSKFINTGVTYLVYRFDSCFGSEE